MGVPPILRRESQLRTGKGLDGNTGAEPLLVNSTSLNNIISVTSCQVDFGRMIYVFTLFTCKDTDAIFFSRSNNIPLCL